MSFRVTVALLGAKPHRMKEISRVAIAAALATLPFSAQAAEAPRLSAPIVFTQVVATGGLLDDSAPARIVRLDPGEAPQLLTTGLYSARDPAVSYDGRHVLFSAKRTPEDFWQIYEMRADGTGLRQVTSEPMDCRQPIYQSYFYVLTSDLPWHQISFVGQERGGRPNLYSTKLDGTALRRLTFNPYGVTDPFLMPDGRIVVSSRQMNRLEGAKRDRAALFGVNLDGADYAVFAAEEGAPWKRMPATNGAELAVFVENTEASADGSGWLAAVTLRRSLQSHRRLTEPGEWLYLAPSPGEDGEVLVSRRPAHGMSTYALVRLNTATGMVAPVHDSADFHDIQARILSPRPEPDGRSSVVNEQDSTGILYGLDVSTTDFPVRDWMPPGTARRLRVLEGLPKEPNGDRPWPEPEVRVVGEVPLATDGSFSIRVPANIPLRLQLLDENGLALRTCEWIWVKNKEPRGCIGCHEDGELAPENGTPEALQRPPVSLTLPPERRRRVRFETDVLPILRQKCGGAACHGGGVPPHIEASEEIRVHVAETARTSPLAWHLFGEDTRRPWDARVPISAELELMPPASATPLTDLERRTILEWIDLGAK